MTPQSSSHALSAEQRAFILSQRIARLATVGEDHHPHVVPICFCLIGNHLYTPIDEKPKRGVPSDLRRLRNIAANPHVQILFDVYEDRDWKNLRFLQLRGVASVIEDASQRASAIVELRSRYSQYEHMSLEDRPLICVSIDRAVEWIAATAAS